MWVSSVTQLYLFVTTPQNKVNPKKQSQPPFPVSPSICHEVWVRSTFKVQVIFKTLPSFAYHWVLSPVLLAYTQPHFQPRVCDWLDPLDFIFLGPKLTADGDCSHEIKRHLLLGRKVMTNLDSIFKSRDITLPTKVRLVKAMVFPVVMY